jgi:hypothetical protein
MYCEYHLERAGAEVPVYRLNMCRDCFRGRPIKPTELRNVDPRPLPVHWDANGNLVLPGTRTPRPPVEDDED